MAKKNRSRNKALAAAWAEQKAAEEQRLAPPPAAVTPIDGAASATKGYVEAQREAEFAAEAERRLGLINQQQAAVDAAIKQANADREAAAQARAEAERQESAARARMYAAPYAEPSASAPGTIIEEAAGPARVTVEASPGESSGFPWALAAAAVVVVAFFKFGR